MSQDKLKKQILITGASRGIGAAIAESLADSSEHNLILVARSKDKLEALAKKIEAKGASTRVYDVDLSDTGAVHQLVNQMEEEFGGIDILINNAGVADMAKAAEQDMDTFDLMVDLNLKALVHLTRRVLPGMIEKKAGTIINTASVASFTAIPNASGYCATKHAVLGYAEALFEEVRDYGIKVSSICPGYVATDMTSGGDLDPELMIQPEDIARTVHYIMAMPDTACPYEIRIKPQYKQKN